MTSISRTAYPYFRQNHTVTPAEMRSYYSLSNAEIDYIKKNIRGDELRLGFAVQLKVFQQFYYFPDLPLIPLTIINFIKEQLTLISITTTLNYQNDSALRRHRHMICDYLSVKRWKTSSRNPDSNKNKASNISAKTLAVSTALNASQTMNHPADIINVAIEVLRKVGRELPPFNTLSRLVKHAREQVNRTIFKSIAEKLSAVKKEMLEDLLITRPGYQRTGFNRLKRLPQKPSISHFKELTKHHQWLMSLGNFKPLLEGVSNIKLRQFAEQARSLDASNLHDFSENKRYALMLSLLVQAQAEAKDALSTTFYKTMVKMHKKSQEKLAVIKEQANEKTKIVATTFMSVLEECKNKTHNLAMLKNIIGKIENNGGIEALHADCTNVLISHQNSALHLLPEFYANKRASLMRLMTELDLQATTQDDLLIKAMRIVQANESSRSDHLSLDIDLSFTTREWRKLILKKEDGKSLIHRQYLEICVFSHLAEDLRSGDIFIDGADSFADYRISLLDLETCRVTVKEYCQSIGLPSNAIALMKHLRDNLAKTAQRVDKEYPGIKEFEIDANGRPLLKKRESKKRPKNAIWLASEIKRRMPERNILDILCYSHHYTGWGNVFGPISGDEPKIHNPIERYILTAFAYGSALGPTQTAQHLHPGVDITAHMLSWVNQRHVSPELLDRAREKLINFYNLFPVLTAWGDGQSCAADGNLRELREENLIAEFHMRYQRKGGIAYHHVSNNYIALFSTFISCGVWEAVEILEGLLKNKSEVKPDTIHADTQGQSTVVFALAYLLGFKLMPRIRNWKEYRFFKPDKKTKYKHIESLFSDPINWQLIETHWMDMMQVVLSIKAGKISSSSLLRKLGSNSRKNKLYFAFQELGRVIRTQFLLEYISDIELREMITATTNKVESYNGLSEWASFGSTVLVASNDEDEMEKAIKYNDILTNSIILQNVIDITDIFGQLVVEGYIIHKEDVAFLSPYLTEHIKRFGDYLVDLSMQPEDTTASRKLAFW